MFLIETWIEEKKNWKRVKENLRTEITREREQKEGQ